MLHRLRAVEAKQADIDAQRVKDVQALVQGKAAQLELPATLWFRPLAAMLVVIAWVSFGLAAIPFHDVMVEVRYWWENTVLQHGLVFFHISAIFLLTVTSSFLNLNRGVSCRRWIITWFSGFIIAIIFNLLAQVVWVYILRLRYPVPFIGTISNLFFGFGAQLFAVWFQLPWEWRKYDYFRTRVKWVMVLHLFSLALPTFYIVVWIIFTLLPADVQPIMAVGLPVSREFIGYILKLIGNIMKDF